MKKNIAVIQVKPQNLCRASSEKVHLAYTLKTSLLSLLFLFAAGMFLFSCEDEEPKRSSKASMTSLTLTIESTDYEITFTGTQGTITLPYSTELPVTATVGAVQLSAKATGIKVGDNVTIPASDPLTLTVTAEDRTTKKTYTVTVKKADPRRGASITSLTLRVEDSDYEIAFADGSYTLILPAGSTLPTAVSVSSVALSPGAAGVANGDQLTVTDNTVTLTVTAENGEIESIYTVTFSVGSNEGASITSLTLTVEEADYEITFAGMQGSVTLPYGTVIPSTVSVASVALSAGAAGVVTGDELTVTDNAVTLTVTAEDGETESEYTVTFSVGANTDASITTLTLTAGTVNYDVTFENGQGSVLLPYGTTIPSTVSVASVALSAGAVGVANDDELTVSDNVVTITVTAEDGETTQEYTVTVENAEPLSSEASITSLTLTAGTVNYDVTFENGQGSVTLPYGTTIPSTVSVASAVLSAGAVGVANDDELTVSDNVVTITVTAEDGTTASEYTVTFSVGASNEASITTLTLTAGTVNYDVTFENGQGSVTLPYGTTIPSTVSVASAVLSAGAVGVANDDELTVSDNVVTITVTAEDGTTASEYTVTFSVGASNEASITTLTLTAGTANYDVTFENGQGSVTLPYGTVIPSTVSVASVALSAGAVGVANDDELTVTDNAVTITVTAEDGTTASEYTVTFSVAANTDASITTLTLTAGTANYDVTFENGQGSVTLPYGTVIPSTVSVASAVLSAGAVGVANDDELTVTDNAVTITVIAEDGATTQEYTVTFSVAANTDASITTLTLTAGTANYDVTFENGQGSVTLPYGTVIPSTVSVASAVLSAGAVGVANDDELTVTDNAVTITVIAEDGATTQEYTVTFSVAANTDASITTLTLTAGTVNYDVTFTGTQGSVTLPYGTVIPSTVSVASATLSAGATGVAVGDARTVTGNAVTLTVTAADGTTTKTYTVTFSVGANTDASITTLTLTAGTVNYDVTFTGTQGSVTLPYGTTIPSTVSVASAVLSAGATGVAAGDALTVTGNAVTLTVTAADGTTTKTYTVTFSVGANTDASITSLTLTAGTVNYDVTFVGTQGSVTLPYGTTIPSTVSVASAVLSAGATGVAAGDARTVTGNAVTLTVTAADGATTQDYTVTFSVGANTDASITTLTLTAGTVNYDVTFVGTQGSVTLPYGTPVPSTVSVASAVLSAGATGVAAGDTRTVSDNAVTLTVTAADGATTKTYTVMFSVGANTDASITSLTLTAGTVNYDVTFVGTQGSVTLPYGTTIPSTVSVASAVLSAGATGVVTGDALTVSDNAVTITVTAEDATTTQEYTVTFSVGANTDASITSLTLTAGTANYDVTFTGTQGSVTLPYGTAIPSTVSVASAVLSAGATGVVTGDALTVTGNAVTITVTAEDATTTQEYTVTFSVAANTDASITTLTLTAGTVNYDVTFTGTQGSVTLPYGTTIPSTVSVASAVLSAGATGVVTGDALTVTGNAVTITVTAEDATTTQDYTVTFSVGANTDASITSLTLTAGTVNYDVTFTGTQGSVTLPYGTAIPSTVSVASAVLSAGATGVVTGDALTVSDNAVTITVTAEDATTTQEYTVTFSVASNTDASITTLTLTAGTANYDVTFTGTQGSVTLPYGTTIPSTVSVASAVLSAGATGVVTGDALTVSDNAVTITVTAEDATTTQEYTVTFSVAANTEALITALTLTVGGIDYDVTFTGRQDTLRVVPYGMPIPSTANVASAVLSAGATGVAVGDALTVSDNAVTLTVTAEDGTTTNTYTVMLGFTTAGITSFTFEVTDNESMALDATDRQQIMGTIDQQAKTIAFDEQSAYVYLDKLKATFEVSETGATVQVGGADQTSGVTEQDFSSSVSYVVRVQGGTETTYTVTLTKSTMATIPDAQFRAKLQEFVPAAFTGDQLDIMHDDVVNNSGTLDVKNQTPKITSLKGIEFFMSLRTLFCYQNALTSLDVSKNTALRRLDCYINSLTSLDVSANTALVRFHCGNNAIASLDVSKNTALTTLYCHGNSLPSLDVSENTALNIFWCQNNSLTFLDMTGMRSVTALNIGTGTGDDNLLETLRVNTAVQDRAEIITMKNTRGAGLTITTVNDAGTEVCTDYTPVETGGTCN